MAEPLPKIEPLVSDLKSLKMGDFLKSNDFKRYCIKVGLEDSWRNAFNHAKDSRGYFSLDLDHDYFDSLDAMVLLLNHLFTNSQANFYHFVSDLLLTYTDWSKEDLKTKNIIADLSLLHTPIEIIDKIEQLGNYYSRPVPKLEIPDNIWNADKLDSVLKKMDLSINRKEYNITVTYAYSCLEGLYKSFIHEKIPACKDVDKLNQLSTLVRDYLKELLKRENILYPEQMINLIPIITNAISNARNSFSDSHFDGESEKWLAEFARDCVNSIGRLIIKFIK